MTTYDQIELVAGPMCGLKTKWPFPDREALLRCPNGNVLYRLEKGDTGKAVYVYPGKQPERPLVPLRP
jgi:hypothetical protein